MRWRIRRPGDFAMMLIAAVGGLFVSEGASLGGGCPVQPVCGAADPPATVCDVVVNKELFMTDLCVVNDLCRTTWDGLCLPSKKGAWTFGKLMASLAGLPSVDTDPQALSDFVRDWLAHWESDQVVNGFTVPARPEIGPRVIQRWEQVSGCSGSGCILDMRKAPFRLSAIVNRIDLRRDALAIPTKGGEGRFVFNLSDIPPDATPASHPCEWANTTFNVILEYFLPADTCEDVLDWADRWHALGEIPFGEAYNQELQEITDDFAGYNAMPAAINGSAIAQVRTNEIFLVDGQGDWELREFKLSLTGQSGPGQLTQVTVAQTPDGSFNDTITLARFLRRHQDEINEKEHVVPLTFLGMPFRAGAAINPPPGPGQFWRAPFFDCTDTRHNFAISACNGCHRTELNIQFVQVSPRDYSNPASLSPFLTGVTAADPSCPPPPVERNFDDLQRRAKDLCDLLGATCLMDIFSMSNIGKTVH